MRTTTEIHKARQKVADMLENPKHNYNVRTRLGQIQVLGQLNKEYHEAHEAQIAKIRQGL